jgi:hypothetical protein
LLQPFLVQIDLLLLAATELCHTGANACVLALDRANAHSQLRVGIVLWLAPLTLTPKELEKALGGGPL